MGGAEFPKVRESGEYDLGLAGHGFFWLSLSTAETPTLSEQPPHVG
ncbi:hypothetical protein [Micromonospora sp. NPDC006431]